MSRLQLACVLLVICRLGSTFIEVADNSWTHCCKLCLLWRGRTSWQQLSNEAACGAACPTFARNAWRTSQKVSGCGVSTATIQNCSATDPCMPLAFTMHLMHDMPTLMTSCQPLLGLSRPSIRSAHEGCVAPVFSTCKLSFEIPFLRSVSHHCRERQVQNAASSPKVVGLSNNLCLLQETFVNS